MPSFVHALFLQNISQHEWEAEEKVNFHSNGIMLDCSRNGVPIPLGIMIILPNLPFSHNFIFIRSQFPKSHGPSGVKLLGTDANFLTVQPQQKKILGCQFLPQSRIQNRP